MGHSLQRSTMPVHRSMGQYVVANVFQHVLRRRYNADEYEYHTRRLDNREISPEDFLMEIYTCPEYRRLNVPDTERNFVRLLMLIFIDREPHEDDYQFHCRRLRNR